jgi:hypothetical protein
MFEGLDQVIKDNFPELHYDNLQFTYPPYVLKPMTGCSCVHFRHIYLAMMKLILRI